MKQRAYLTECVGTAALLCAVVGSGIMAQNLAVGNMAVALMANTLATVFALYVLIELCASVSGAHFNPVVSLLMVLNRTLKPLDCAAYWLAQCFGAVLGVYLAHLMFDLDALQWSKTVRSSQGQWISEIVATAGLAWLVLRAPAGKAASLVACYIGSAYWFTASTSFANPAATLARMMTDSFAGIAPSSVPAFLLAQLLGALIAYAAHRVTLDE